MIVCYYLKDNDDAKVNKNLKCEKKYLFHHKDYYLCSFKIFLIFVL